MLGLTEDFRSPTGLAVVAAMDLAIKLYSLLHDVLPRSSTKTVVTSRSFSYYSVNKWYLICSLVITNAFISRQLPGSAQGDTCLILMSIHVFVVPYVSISHNLIKACVDAKELFYCGLNTNVGCY